MSQHCSALRFVLGLGALAFIGCGGPSEYVVTGQGLGAAADGIVQVEAIEGGSSLVTLTLDHLPPPARLGEGASVYVVWFVHEGQAPVKAGSLDYDEDGRRGSMFATTPFSTFMVRVTAEADTSVSSPSEVLVAQRGVGGASN